MKTSKPNTLTVWATALLLTVALVALAIAGCGSDTDDPGPAPTTPPTDDLLVPEDGLTLRDSDNGGSFTVSVGDSVVVTLAGNPTTGYEWTSALAAEDTVLLVAASEEPIYTPDPVDENMVGSGGEFTFVFTAAVAGQAEIRLNYWRPFEPQAEPNQTFVATVTIR